LREVEAPTFSDIRPIDGGKVVRFTPRPLLPQEDSWYSLLLEAESTPGPTVRMEGLGKLKNLPHPGLEPATFQLIA
jgi:hypothetical protein